MKKYDLVFSLGAACSCSQALRLANLQFASFPCDWLWGGSPEARAKALVEGFDGLLDELKLVRHEIPWNLEHEPWRHVDTGIVFKHDFDWNTPLAETLPGVREKYARRLARLSGRIAASKSVLVVWLNPPTCTDIEASRFAEVRQMLAAKWPGVAFDLLVTRCESRHPVSERTDETRDGVRVVSWDYDDAREAFVDNAKMAAFFAEEISVADYRTESEKDAWPARQKALRYAQYSAKTWWGYVANRALWRFYRHVRKMVERRGLLRLGR